MSNTKDNEKVQKRLKPLAERKNEKDRNQAIREVFDHADFSKMIKDIVGDKDTSFKMEAKALDALKECAKTYMMDVFEGSNLVASGRGRHGVRRSDMELVRLLRGDHGA